MVSNYENDISQRSAPIDISEVSLFLVFLGIMQETLPPLPPLYHPNLPSLLLDCQLIDLK